MAGGRPPFEITEEIINKTEALAAQGLTKLQIALCLGIAYNTLNNKQKENEEFLEAIKRGQAKGLAQISNSLFDNAKGGNVTSQIFYLKNRDPDNWKDVQQKQHSGGIEITAVERQIVDPKDPDS